MLPLFCHIHSAGGFSGARRTKGTREDLGNGDHSLSRGSFGNNENRGKVLCDMMVHLQKDGYMVPRACDKIPIV